jgi:hypothetical protein
VRRFVLVNITNDDTVIPSKAAGLEGLPNSDTRNEDVEAELEGSVLVMELESSMGAAEFPNAVVEDSETVDFDVRLNVIESTDLEDEVFSRCR